MLRAKGRRRWERIEKCQFCDLCEPLRQNIQFSGTDETFRERVKTSDIEKDVKMKDLVKTFHENHQHWKTKPIFVPTYRFLGDYKKMDWTEDGVKKDLNNVYENMMKQCSDAVDYCLKIDGCYNRDRAFEKKLSKIFGEKIIYYDPHKSTHKMLVVDKR